MFYFAFCSICTIFALRRVRSLAAPQQLKNISLRSACTDFVIKSQRKRISMTYMDIIHHGMPPSDTTTTNLPEWFRGVPKMCFIIIKYPNVYIN